MKINKRHTFYTVQIPKLHGLLTRSYTLCQLTPEDSPGTLSTVSIGCNCNYLSQIWQHGFARFLILPGEVHPGGPKPNCHNPGLGAPILYKLPLLPPGGKRQEYKFLLRNPRILLALVQTLLTCVLHLKSLVIVTPRYLMLSTFSRSVPSKVYEAWIFLIRFLVSCIILHLIGWNLIPHFLAQEPNRSCNIPLKFHCVFFVLNFTIANTVISKKSYFRLNIWWDVTYAQRE